jgi:RND family efflux transporter MFP subunit
MSVPSTYEATGTVQARVSAAVSAKMLGYAKEVHAQIGDQVREGQTLVVIDSREQDASVREAEAGRNEVASGIPEADGAIAAAKSQLDLAQVTFGRMQDLLQKRSVTQQEFDEAAARWKGAQAGLDMARARRSQLDSRLARAEQAVRSAGIQKTYATIAAPFSGIILTKSIEPGALVLPGAPLLTLERSGNFRLEVNVEESRLREVRAGEAATLTIDDHNLPGRVSEIVPSVDGASRTGVVKFDLPSLPGLRSGIFGRASFAAGERPAVTVPKTAGVEHGSLQSVFVVERGIGRLRLVTLGESAADRIEILSGLDGGEIVVAPVPPGISDGARLEVRR